MKRELTNHLFSILKMLQTDDTVMEKQDGDKLLDVLKDGKWHTAKEIMDKTRIEEHKEKLLMSFLREFEFIQADKKADRMRLNPSTKEFLEKLGKINPTSSYEEITA